MVSATSFYRNLGLGGGSLWLIEVGAAFTIWALFTIHSSLATGMLVLVAVASAVLLFFGIRLMLRVRRLSHGPADDPSRSRRIGVRFGTIFAAELVACGAVAAVCVSTHHWKWIVPLQLIVVGLHFLPLARLFDVPRYNLLGISFCAISIATLLFTSSSAHIGHAFSWIVAPSLGCGLMALITGAAGLDEVQGFLHNSSGLSPAGA